MITDIESTRREAVLVEDAALIRMMGMLGAGGDCLPRGTYELTDPFILVHPGAPGRFRPLQLAGTNTRHPQVERRQPLLGAGRAGQHRPHRPTGRSDQAGTASEGSLLWLRTERGARAQPGGAVRA